MPHAVRILRRGAFARPVMCRARGAGSIPGHRWPASRSSVNDPLTCRAGTASDSPQWRDIDCAWIGHAGAPACGMPMTGSAPAARRPLGSAAPRPAQRALDLVEAYWTALRGARLVPSRSEVDPRGIEAALDRAFVAERIAPGVARLRLAGAHLADLNGDGGAGDAAERALRAGRPARARRRRRGRLRRTRGAAPDAGGRARARRARRWRAGCCCCPCAARTAR